MALMAVDVGGTKVAGALFSQKGKLLKRVVKPVSGLRGDEIGFLITRLMNDLMEESQQHGQSVSAAGVSVPGIYDSGKKKVWAPNLPGWESYPLDDVIAGSFKKKLPVFIESDRSCYMLGEVWQGNARGCKNAVFIAVGTGIGAGILVDGRILRGAGNSAGAVGWMGLKQPHLPGYSRFGCFEYHASGNGIARVAKSYLKEMKSYDGKLKHIPLDKLTAKEVFAAYERGDLLAAKVIGEAVELWGVAAANLVSIFNPEIIILGGGVFDTVAPLLEQIKKEAERWAQPVAIGQVSLKLSALGSDAGIYGAAFHALTSVQGQSHL